ncbi:tRNA CCA-pyrophosphorylase [Nanobdella aerobiophila]|uniref:CCA-adding enzyme n=1 Tax=Nanobdella aerobiophila TaxID=2586965 RepID=A0A915SCU3_9ARCH|nr:CCA tRNA nucleotidyltransferase [Nanobdella aerobiophila]BBL45673.1 tRNA CCA-pyrophosphorylase [Nanobdella aerobiophila]
MDLNKILNNIKPTEEDKKRVYNIINKFFNILKSNDLEPILGGSFAKDTWIKTDFDIDTFILFENEENMKKLENILKKENFNYEKIKGSRDYFRVLYEGYIFELVPILKIKNIEDAKNTTDLSPFHVIYVLDKIKNTDMNDQIRLMKLFMKNIGVYGAESYIRGFSGYATEIITIYYKSFLNSIQNIDRWFPKVVIDIENYYRNIDEIKKNLTKDKLKSPVIIIDPTNKYRNIGASISIQKFSELIFYSRLFLNSDNKEEFFNKKFIKDYKDIENLTNKYNLNFLYINIEGNSNNKDIKFSKSLSLFLYIKKLISDFGIKIFNYYYNFDRDTFNGYILYYNNKLPEYEIKMGPLVWERNFFEKFYNKHKNEELIIRNGKICSITKRELNDIDDIIKYILTKYKNKIKQKSSKIYIKVNNKEFIL